MLDLGIDFRELSERLQKNYLAVPALVGYFSTLVVMVGCIVVWSSGAGTSGDHYLISLAFFGPLVSLAAYLLELSHLYIVGFSFFAFIWPWFVNQAYVYNKSNADAALAGSILILIAYPVVTLVHRELLKKATSALDKIMHPYSIAGYIAVFFVALGWILSVTSDVGGQLGFLALEAHMVILVVLFLFDLFYSLEYVFVLATFAASISCGYLVVALNVKDDLNVEDDAQVQAAFVFVWLGAISMLALLCYKGTVQKLSGEDVSDADDEYESI
eukprot:TRINITY_DN2130_c0_g1_i1.p1 TRINITY_DN2130_c0_g1~~TRINITY_DN2130_c0_g1_i1.p1  ORF type:complete len:290 (+),score=102.02 TRINITY_DN2130_c0_g1_i1:57-872(+)